MRTLSLIAPVALALASLALAGCDDFVITIRTRIDPGGRLEREMRIENAGKEAKTAVEKAFVLPEAAHVVERSEDGKRVVLALEASAPGTLPSDFVVRSAEAEKAGRPLPRNAVEWQRRDCVLFDHYVYRETFRDSVDEADRDAATERLFSLCRDLVMAAAAIEAGDRYDTGPLGEYLDGPGRRIFFDLVRIACTEKDAKRLERRVAARLGAEGLGLPLDAKDDAVAEEVSRFAIEKVAACIVPRQEGAPPFDARPILATDEGAQERLLALLKSAEIAVHGSEEKAGKAFTEAIHAVHGDIDGAPVEVAASVVLPGRPLRTNGWLGEPDRRETRAYWEFGARDIARTGHVLELETIVDRPEVRSRLPSPAASLSDEVVMEVIRGLSERSDEERLALSRAFGALDGKRSPEEVEATLPEGLRGDFGMLVGAGSRSE